MVLIRALTNLQKLGGIREQFLRSNPVKFHSLPSARCLRSFKDAKGGSGKWPLKKPSLQPIETPFEGVVIESKIADGSSLLKPFVFTVAFSGACFGAAAIWEYEKLRSKAVSLFRSPSRWFHERQMKRGHWRTELNRWWNGLTEGQRIFVPICFANILVFLAWKVPAFQPAMVKYFCSNPASKAVCWPMTLSTFSHYSTLHLLANMYVLHSFSSGSVNSMGREQFLGFYMAAGVISSFASYVHKVVVSRPGLSLGASGAIMGVLGYACSRYPDLQLSVIFFPFFTFKASMAIKVIMGIDAAGILLGWKLFDHAAHLGGALFGMFWCYWGSAHIWHNREPVIEAWHKMRGAAK